MSMNMRLKERGLVVSLVLLLVVCSFSVLPLPARAALTPQWTAATAMGDTRTQAVVVQDENGLVYVIGGVNGISGGTYAPDVSNVSSYNPATGQWVNLAPLPQATRGAAGAYSDGKIYVIGGWNSSLNRLDITQIYDIASNTWSSGARCPTGVWEGKAAAMSNGRIYVIGGETGLFGYSSSLYIYDPVLDGWAMGASMPVGVKSGAAVYDGFVIYYMGGRALSGASSALYVYYPWDSWSTLASMPSGVSSLAAAIGTDGFIYAIGGGADHFNVGAGYNSTYYFDPSAGVWGTGPNMSMKARYLGAVSTSDGRILAFGGNDVTSVFSNVESMRIMSLTTSVSPSSVGSGRPLLVTVTVEFAFAVPDGYSGSAALMSETGTAYNPMTFSSPTGGTFAFEMTVPSGVASGDYEVLLFDFAVSYTVGSHGLEDITLPVVVTAASTFDQQIASLEAELAALQVQLAGTDVNVTAVQAALNSVQTQLNALKTDQTAQGAQLTGLDTALTALQNQINDLQDQLDNVKTTSDSSNLMGTLNLVLLIVVIVLLALMFVMSRKSKAAPPPPST